MTWLSRSGYFLVIGLYRVVIKSRCRPERNHRNGIIPLDYVLNAEDGGAWAVPDLAKKAPAFRLK